MSIAVIDSFSTFPVVDVASLANDLIVDLRIENALNASGLPAQEGEPIANWKNNVTGNSITGASQSDITKRPIMRVTNNRAEIKFDGVNDFLDFGRPSELNFTTASDVTFMIVCGSQIPDGALLHKGYNALREIGMFYYGGWDIYFLNTQIGSPTPPEPYAIVDLSFKGTTNLMDSYLNGVLDVTGTISSTSTSPLSTLLGARQNNIGGTSWAFFYAGSMVRVLIWKKVLTSVERIAVYNEIKYKLPPVTIDADANAVILYIESVGGSLDATKKLAILNLILGYKANGTWSKHIAIYGMIGGNAASHGVNFKDPQNADTAYRMTFSGTWVHDSNGARGNGSTAFGQTFIRLPSRFPATAGKVDMNIGYYSNFETPSNTNQQIFGNWGVSGADYIYAQPYGISANAATIACFSTDTNVVGSLASHLKYVAINMLNGVGEYRENANIFVTNSQTVAAPAAEYLCMNMAGQGDTTTGVKGGTSSLCRSAFFCVGRGLTPAESAADYSIIQAYQTTLGRQV